MTPDQPPRTPIPRSTGGWPRPLPNRLDQALLPLPVTVLSGLDPLLVDDLATAVLLRHERLAVVHADPSNAELGHISIHVAHSAGTSVTRNYPLQHQCVNCTLRAALVTQLRELARAAAADAVLVQLHPGIEVDSMLRGLHRDSSHDLNRDLPVDIRLDTHVAVLGADWLDILSGGTTLSDHHAAIGAEDDRFAATLVCAAIETATTLVVASRPQRNSELLADERAVLDLLAPAVVRLRLRHVLEVPDGDILRTGRFDPAQLHPLCSYGIRDQHRHLPPESTLSLVRWSAARPLHPLRLHDALDKLADGVIRSSGRLDVADQPDAVVGWDSAGKSLQLGPIHPWPSTPHQRRSTLTLLGDGLDAEHIRDTLEYCLLDDTELAIATCTWDDVADICPGWPAPDPEDAARNAHPAGTPVADRGNPPATPDRDRRRRGDDAA